MENNNHQIMKITKQIESSLSEIPWTRTVAAGSLVIGALLLITGRRKSALAVSAAVKRVMVAAEPKFPGDLRYAVALDMSTPVTAGVSSRSSNSSST